MGKVVGSILGGGGKTQVVRQPVEETAEAKRRASASRSALFETQGGVEGEELSPDDVDKRRTLLGN